MYHEKLIILSYAALHWQILVEKKFANVILEESGNKIWEKLAEKRIIEFLKHQLPKLGVIESALAVIIDKLSGLFMFQHITRNQRFYSTLCFVNWLLYEASLK